MRISLILELLLIFILLAFVASKSIKSKSRQNELTSSTSTPQIISTVSSNVASSSVPSAVTPAPPQEPASYCSCSKIFCNCCRDFRLPLLGMRGPGCASLQYLQGDRIAVALSFADRVVTNTTISSRRPNPVCMPLPGGITRFCGRLYNIKRDKKGFKACLGLELRSLSELEASVRVSCFRFGPEGIKTEPAQPLPVLEEDDDDDDDDDDFGFDVDDDDDDDDDDGVDFDDDDEGGNDADDDSFGVFRGDFFEDLFDDDSDTKKKPQIKRISTTTTTKRPLKVYRRPSVRPSINKIKNIASTTPLTTTTNKNLLKLSTTTIKPVRVTLKPSKSTPKPQKVTSLNLKPLSVTTRRPSTVKRNKTKKRPSKPTTTTRKPLEESISEDIISANIISSTESVLPTVRSKPIKTNQISLSSTSFDSQEQTSTDKNIQPTSNEEQMTMNTDVNKNIIEYSSNMAEVEKKPEEEELPSSTSFDSQIQMVANKLPEMQINDEQSTTQISDKEEMQNKPEEIHLQSFDNQEQIISNNESSNEEEMVVNTEKTDENKEIFLVLTTESQILSTDDNEEIIMQNNNTSENLSANINFDGLIEDEKQITVQNIIEQNTISNKEDLKEDEKQVTLQNKFEQNTVSNKEENLNQDITTMKQILNEDIMYTTEQDSEILSSELQTITEMEDSKQISEKTKEEQSIYEENYFLVYSSTTDYTSDLS